MSNINSRLIRASTIQNNINVFQSNKDPANKENASASSTTATSASGTATSATSNNSPAINPQIFISTLSSKSSLINEMSLVTITITSGVTGTPVPATNGFEPVSSSSAPVNPFQVSGVLSSVSQPIPPSSSSDINFLTSSNPFSATPTFFGVTSSSDIQIPSSSSSLVFALLSFQSFSVDVSLDSSSTIPPTSSDFTSSTFVSSFADTTSSSSSVEEIFTSESLSSTQHSTEASSSTSHHDSITSTSSSTFTPYSTTMSEHGTTITTFITVPTSSSEDSTHSNNTTSRNSKLIGGLVGSIGGTIVISGLVLLFLFLKRRRNGNYKNQSPDFNDDVDSDALAGDHKSGFQKLFGSKTFNPEPNTTQFNHVTHPSDFEKQDDDFEYRGVTNNNLDSVFRSSSQSGTASVGNTIPHTENTTGQNSLKHTRYNSFSHPPYGDLPEENDSFNFNADNLQHGRQDSDEFDPSVIANHDGLPIERGQIFTDGTASNNSRSRFTEEI